MKTKNKSMSSSSSTTSKKKNKVSDEQETDNKKQGVKRRRDGSDDAKQSKKQKTTSQSPKKTPKKKKDPNEPKKPISGYLRFCEDYRPKVQEELKTKDVKVVSVELGKMWKELDPKIKDEYNQAFKKENEVFKEVIKEYKANKSSSEDEGEEEEQEVKKTQKKKKKKDPNAPKRPLTGYILYTKEKRAEVVEENPQLKPTEIARELGKRWKALSDSERAEYSKSYKEQKQQYDEDFKLYKEQHPSDSESSEEEQEEEVKKSTPKKKKKDPSAPKQPPNSFNLYSSEVRQAVKDENPSADHKEIAKIIGNKWKALSSKEKEKYVKEASAQKNDFLQKQKDYEANQKKQEKMESSLASTSTKSTTAKRKKTNVIDDEDEEEESEDEEESGDSSSGEDESASSSSEEESDDE